MPTFWWLQRQLLEEVLQKRLITAIDHFASRFDRALPSEEEISAIADSKVSRAPSSDTALNSFGRIAGAWDWLLECGSDLIVETLHWSIRPEIWRGRNAPVDLCTFTPVLTGLYRRAGVTQSERKFRMNNRLDREPMAPRTLARIFPRCGTRLKQYLKLSPGRHQVPRCLRAFVG